MFRIVVLMTCPLAAVAVSAPAPVPKAAASADLDELEGTWEMVSFWQRGEEAIHRYSFVVVAEGKWRYWTRINGRSSPSGGEYKIGLSRRKTPKGYDLTPVGANNDNGIRGIYELKGDELTVCYRIRGNVIDGRPTKLDGTEKEVWHQVFRRKKSP